jgi:hypothetical protein
MYLQKDLVRIKIIGFNFGETSQVTGNPVDPVCGVLIDRDRGQRPEILSIFQKQEIFRRGRALIPIKKRKLCA